LSSNRLRKRRIGLRVLRGLINPLADQPKINVGLLCLGSGMTTMIAIVFAIGLALLLAYFVK
jgi:ABC-type phosphate transport system permease subunit